jgi:hypothetical protein
MPIKIAVVIPTRGTERNLFTSQAKKLLAKQTRQPDEVIWVDHAPINDKPDLTQRYKMGFTQAFSHGADLVICAEDDDWYDEKYIEIMEQEWIKNSMPDVIGINKTIYYNINTNQYVELSHPGRASMMSMAVGKGILNMKWCADDYTYLDWHIWNFAKDLTKVAVMQYKPICVGIKHGIGLCGGGGHINNWKNYNKTDKDWAFLETIIPNEDIKFYKDINEGQLHIQG